MMVIEFKLSRWHWRVDTSVRSGINRGAEIRGAAQRRRRRCWRRRRRRRNRSARLCGAAARRRRRMGTSPYALWSPSVREGRPKWTDTGVVEDIVAEIAQRGGSSWRCPLSFVFPSGVAELPPAWLHHGRERFHRKTLEDPTITLNEITKDIDQIIVHLCFFFFLPNLIYHNLYTWKEFEKLVQEALASRPVQTGRRKSEVEEVQLRCIKCDHVFTSLSAAVKLRSVSSVALNQVKGNLIVHTLKKHFRTPQVSKKNINNNLYDHFKFCSWAGSS